MSKNAKSDRRIVFICPALGQPRYHRRALDLMPYFGSAVALCYERGFYKENTWPEGVEQILLPKSTEGFSSHFEKLKVFPKAYAKVKDTIHRFEGPQLIYAFGIEAGVLANRVRRKGDIVIWEMGDLVTPFWKNPIKRKLVAQLEKWILRKSDRMVNVCQGMFDLYYGKLVPNSRGKLIVVENRLPDTFKRCGGATKTHASKPLRLGWSGSLRNLEYYGPLLEAVAADGGKRVSLGVWGGGFGADDAKAYADRCENITMYGSYKESPEVLREIHEKTDVLVTLEDSTNVNFQCAFVNRWSHALVYETPMIVSKNTVMAEKAEEMGIGMGVDELHEDWNAVFDRLADGKIVDEWIANMRSVPEGIRYSDSRSLVSYVSQWTQATNPAA